MPTIRSERPSCLVCHKAPAINGRSRCRPCFLDYNRARMKSYRQRPGYKRKRNRFETPLPCVDCGKRPKFERRTRCKQCHEKNATRRRNRRPPPICIDCKKSAPMRGRVRCATCYGRYCINRQEKREKEREGLRISAAIQNALQIKFPRPGRIVVEREAMEKFKHTEGPHKIKAGKLGTLTLTWLWSEDRSEHNQVPWGCWQAKWTGGKGSGREVTIPTTEDV